ncbi:hypothetical protein [Fibrella forsythiae]|uniref:Uncharacterized protein n=1 Tax=Fibrella forsythiae TaxID=2817061 RepID=A0ABS3JSK9_9BACT|nr:hypothetical protein [Fibrella forsythiae]MBO0953000.1 hypothetical protein [Fibrella forsythiae]
MSSSASCRSLSLPVTPLVKRIILASTKGEALFVSREQRKPFNPYSAYLFALLQRERRAADGQAMADEHLTESLEIQIPEWQMRAGCIESITPARAVAFNTFVTNSFRQRLREEIELRLETTRFLKEAAERALARWGIDEDTYPLSAAIRHYTRHRSESTETTATPTDSLTVA